MVTENVQMLPAPRHCARRSPRAWRRKHVLALLAAAGLCCIGPAGGSEPVPTLTLDGPLIGFTEATRTAKLCVGVAGRVSAMYCRIGDDVAADAVLATLDMRLQEARTDIARQRAESTLDVEQKRVVHARAVEERERTERLCGSGAANEEELRTARTEEVQAELEWRIALRDHAIVVQEHIVQQRLLEQHFVRAPFAGFIVEQLKEVGEAADLDEPVLRLVQLDPLKVVVNCPAARLETLAPGDTLSVRLVDGDLTPRTARVTYVSRVVDPGSQTGRVELELANPDACWRAGQRVEVNHAPGRSAGMTGAAE